MLRGISKKIEADGVVAAEAAPVLRVAICGEVSSGKSTVLNSLLRGRILPDNIGSTSRPVIVASYRPEPGVEVLQSDGQRTTFETIDDPELFRDATHVKLWSDHAHLAGLEIIEVPLTKAEMLTDEQIDLIRGSDVMIWVTIASQAWRLTEMTIVEQLGEARPAHAILAVTRADKLRTDRDRARLKERMVRETNKYFEDCIFINGTRQKIGKAGDCDSAWAETGAVEILSTIDVFADRILNGGAEKKKPAPEASETSTVEVVDLDAFRAAAPAESAAVEPVGEPDAEAETADVPVVETEAATAEAAETATVEETEDDETEDEAEVAAAEVVAAPASQAKKAASDTEPSCAYDAACTLAGGLPGIVAAGFGASGDASILHGEEASVEAIGTFCHSAFDILAGMAAPLEADSPVTFNMSMNDNRILFQRISGGRLAYLMLATSAMSHGSAQAALSGLCRALEARI